MTEETTHKVTGRALKQATRQLALVMPPYNVVGTCPCGGEVGLSDSGIAGCRACGRFYRVAFVVELTPYRKQDQYP